MIPLVNVVHTHRIKILYIDKTQLILFLSDDDSNTINKFKACMMKVAKWVKACCLKLNIDMTEEVIVGNNTSPWNPNPVCTLGTLKSLTTNLT